MTLGLPEGCKCNPPGDPLLTLTHVHHTNHGQIMMMRGAMFKKGLGMGLLLAPKVLIEFQSNPLIGREQKKEREKKMQFGVV